MEQLKRISIITGHYGSGKTNVAVNLALKLHKSGKKVIIVDLDIVNPYFRTADFKELLEAQGIQVITPTFANTNLDIPALPAQINTIFDQQDSYIVIDVGGDDAGAIALGRYAHEIIKQDYDMFYVINERRYQTRNPQDAIALLHDIEACARVKATKLINNTNLGALTTVQTLTDSFEFADKISELTKLPIAFSCFNEACLNQEIDKQGDFILPVEIFVKPFYE
ncbi:P-loop NTPase [Paludicola sp. MB14-C6]|uniref:nucleotide-binding protein n=1 Tax=Paludihabitans sp. MB14-C6 TaxID=3070656 RepID=UPI0027DB3556|nr:P-loop NTPase [Paludicola sp. MB14-C6]WMJ22783.1 P-loop NTPase [Paludicola sp. MB14-C6]